MKFKDRLSAVGFVFWTFVVPITVSFYHFATLYNGWHIPNQDEIQRTEGVMSIKRIQVAKNDTEDHVVIKNAEGQSIELTCNYSPIYKSDISGCVHTDEQRQNIQGKQGVITWYKQKPFLIFNNEYPQLLFITVDG